MKKLISCVLCIIMLLCLTACADKADSASDNFDTKASTKMPDEVMIAENDRYRLEWDSVNIGIALVEKSTGKRFGTTPIEEGVPTIDEYGMPIKRNPQIQSSLIIEYLSGEEKQVKRAISYTGAFKNGRIVTSPVKDGIRVEYYFDEEKIMVPVEYVLRSDSVAVTFDPNQVKENENQLVSVALAPFWCSAKNDSEDSYLFVPSGSGALVSCKTLSQPGSKFLYPVFGQDAVMQKEDNVSSEKSVLLPVYGSKFGEIASCAIIEESAESAVINTIVGSSAIKFSTVYAAYQVRGYSSNTAALLYNNKEKRNVYAEKMADKPMTVGLYPLSEKADYNGMADVYKDHLRSKKVIEKKKDDNALSLTFVGGMMVDKSFLGVPYTEVLAATTLKDAGSILKEMSAQTKMKINAKLLGFGETGIDISKYAGGFKINNNLGSVKDLSELSDYCKNNDIGLFFDFDLIRYKKGGGYSSWFDSAQNACYKIAVGYKYDIATRSRIEDEKFYYLSRKQLTDSGDRLLKKTEKWNLSGVSVSSLSNIAYSDYSDKKDLKYYSKSNMAVDVDNIISKLSGSYKVAVTEANEYAVTYADVIYDTPASSSKEKTFICDIPFYQMVFKGYIPMAGENLNLVEDRNKQILLNVESGAGLSYMLTAEYYNEFIDSTSFYFFGTKYDDIKDKMYQECKDLCSYYEAVNGAEIVSHMILDNSVRETVYDNGIRAYVNYSDQSAHSPIGEVEAYSYLWGDQHE